MQTVSPEEVVEPFASPPWFKPGLVIPGLLLAIVLGWSLLTSLVVRWSADRAVLGYFAGQSEVKGYRVKGRTWSRFCCSHSVLTAPRTANGVRYQVKVFFKDGHSEEEILDLGDGRNPVDQFESFERGLGGGQRWEVDRVYGPGEDPPPLEWEV